MLPVLVFVLVFAGCLFGIYRERWRIWAGRRAWLARKRRLKTGRRRRLGRHELQLLFCLALLVVIGAAGLTGHNVGRRTFSRCAQAASAGYGQMKRGEAEYRPWLDADDDGVACEWNPKTRSPANTSE